MATQIQNKKGFLTWLENELDDNDVILITTDIEDVSLKKKRNSKQVKFDFAADAFKSKDDVGHIAFRKTPVVAFSVASKEDVSEETASMFDSIK